MTAIGITDTSSPLPRSRLERGRILFLIDGLGMGGAEHLLSSTLPALHKAGFDTRVCALQVRDGNPAAVALEREGIAVDIVYLRRLRNIRQIAALFGYLDNREFDVLHAQLEASDILGPLYGRRRCIPVFCTLHTVEDPKGAARRRAMLLNWVLRNYCDRILCVSEYMRQHYIDRLHYPPHCLLTLYNGIDLTAFDSISDTRIQIRRSISVPISAPLLTTVAVLRPPKGIGSMIRAMPAVLAQHADARYLIVGDGEDEQALRSLTLQLGLDDRVIFAGRRSDIAAILGASDIFVLPSLKDALPTVLAEAMAACLPIVATAVGGIPEMVISGTNGYLVAPNDSDRLASACKDLLNDPDAAATLGLQGRRIAERLFNIERHVEKLCTLYDEAIARSKKRARCE